MANSNNSRYRVSLKFSDKDKDQEEVVALLKQMGRRKSAFITKAVKYYLSENPEADIPGITSATISKSSMKAVLKELLAEMDIDSAKLKEVISKKETSVNEKQIEPIKNEAKKVQAKEESIQEELSDDEVDSFLAGLDAWDMSDF